MAQTASLRTAHASGLGAVERELQALHRAGLRHGDDASGVRLSVLTFVVACMDAAAARLAGEVIGEVSAGHPMRALLVVADRRAPGGIEADLSLQRSTAPGGEQVCAEVVRLPVGGDAALHLVSVVTPLLLADVPVQLWLCGAPDLTQALAPEVLATCERLILDSAAYPDAVEVLAELAGLPPGDAPGGIAVSDLAWARLAGWRELLARTVDGAARRPYLGGIERIAVRGSAAARGAPEVLLLAAWLQDRLGTAVQVETVEAAGGSVAAVFLEARSGDSRLEIDVVREEGSLAARVSVDDRLEAAWSVAAEPPRLAELVGAALQAQGPDRVYEAALRAAAGLLR